MKYNIDNPFSLKSISLHLVKSFGKDKIRNPFDGSQLIYDSIN